MVQIGVSNYLRVRRPGTGEMLLSMGVPYKPTELFFECMVYQGKLDLWRKLKISTKDISCLYVGIGMQDKLLKEHKYENI